jgi:hypothetical protein
MIEVSTINQSCQQKILEWLSVLALVERYQRRVARLISSRRWVLTVQEIGCRRLSLHDTRHRGCREALGRLSILSKGLEFRVSL